MNAVNLLPEKHRPRKPTGGQRGSGYVVLGVLGAVLVGVLVYVLTLNSINSSKSEITQAKAEAVRLDSQAQSLGAYGDFAKIKAERVKAVQQLASGRFDWERLVRELAQVLPSDVWIVNASASLSGADSSSTPASAPAAATGAPAPVNPKLQVQGCARDQQQVAVTLVRLRQLQGATDVALDHSTRGADASGPSASPAPSGGAAGATVDSGCGTTGGKPNYSFQASVTFSPLAPKDHGAVPDRLGGGA
jgi:Tfp pilus assembly protein PilN